ncbi:MarR family winged helix-turn-helix transcriptional regulator [Undibacterium terreum]|nr:MarR family winged helix-turn-helix transcriptional regulator [Undibacterium terreum]
MQSELNIASCNCLALRKATRAISAFYDRYLAPSGLSSVQFSVLSVIHERPGIGMQQLSDELVMDRTSLVRAIQPLTREGYIEQAPDPDNSRKRALSLSADGRKKFKKAETYWQQAQAEFEQQVGASSASALRGELSTLAHSF